MTEIKRTERGWAGHFCNAKRCLFRRNTLLEYGDQRVIVSTVGAGIEDGEYVEVGSGRMYETMVFPARRDGSYWDACIGSGPVQFDREGAIGGPMQHDCDQRANDMHENVVAEFIERLSRGEKFPRAECYQQ